MPESGQIAGSVHAEDGRTIAAPVEQVQPQAVDFDEQIAGSRRRHACSLTASCPESMGDAASPSTRKAGSLQRGRSPPLPGVSGGVPLKFFFDNTCGWAGGRMNALQRNPGKGGVQRRNPPLPGSKGCPLDSHNASGRAGGKKNVFWRGRSLADGFWGLCPQSSQYHSWVGGKKNVLQRNRAKEKCRGGILLCVGSGMFP